MIMPRTLASRLALALVFTATVVWAPRAAHAQTEPTTMKKATPLITVDAIEPCLPFWTDALGFELTATVPHGDAIGFAMLNKGNVELMYQSRASIDADLGASGGPAARLGSELGASTTALFVEVEDLDAVIAALGDDVEVLVPRRQTFYGMDEIFVRAPCGTVVGFAAPVAPQG
jgi:uncharacterized glyoxalase superfamily protein PhnB